jgi:hypothetical protein
MERQNDAALLGGTDFVPKFCFGGPDPSGIPIPRRLPPEYKRTPGSVGLPWEIARPESGSSRAQ